MNKKYLTLYEKLYDLNDVYDDAMQVDMKESLNKEPVITIFIKKTFLDKSIIKEIIKLCDKAGARMGFLSHGVIRINFPKKDGSISLYD